MDDINLYYFFAQSFSIDEIYNLGWYAARDWIAVVSGVLVAIAIAIRSVETKVEFFTKGKSNWTGMITTTLLVAIAIGLYFVIASLVIDILNSIYRTTDNSTMREMSERIDELMDGIFDKDWSFNILSFGYEAILMMGSLLLYAITYCILVFMIWAMKICHAVLVTFVIFWGAVALPMSITTGLKQLSAFKNIAILAAIWPIVDAFLMYVVGGTFLVGMESDKFSIDSRDDISMTLVIFYLSVFSIINIFLIATAFAAPFVAQGLANGSGNVTGLIGSFAGAGLSAGVVAGKSVMSRYASGVKNAHGSMMGKSVSEGGRGLRALTERAAGALGHSVPSNPSAGAGASAMQGGTRPLKGSVADVYGANKETGTSPSPSGKTENKTSTTSKTVASTAPASGGNNTSAGGGSAKVSGQPPAGKHGFASSDLTEDQMREGKPSKADSESGDMAEQEKIRKAKAQARRAAMIQNQKKQSKS